MSDYPESDRLGDFPHPRENPFLFGHAAAETRLLEMMRSGKMHHGWILSGPRGIGKATLAYRLARFLFAYGVEGARAARSLAVPEDHPVFSRVAASGHADLLTIRRPYDEKTKKIKRDITVEEMRRIGPFFGKKAGEGGWRIAIIDAADDMNINAANALLKTLEEPPENALVILVTHAPGRLLSTIRSRCQRMQLEPLETVDIVEAVGALEGLQPQGLKAADVAHLAPLAEGSVGRALELTAAGGLDYYRALVTILTDLPEIDMRKLETLAGTFAGVKGAAAWPIFQDLFLDSLSRLARMAATGQEGVEVMEGENAALRSLAARIGPKGLVDLWEEARELFGRTDAVNLDRRHVIMSMVFRIESAVKTAA